MLYKSRNVLFMNIGGVDTLIPLAQNICDRMPILRLNDTGSEIWKMTGFGSELSDLVSRLALFYDLSEDDMEDFRRDITDFTDQLIDCHAIVTEPDDKKSMPGFKLPALTTLPSAIGLSAAGLDLLLHTDKKYIHPDLRAFISDTPAAESHQDVFFSSEKTAAKEFDPVIDDPLLTLYEYENGYLYHHPANRSLKDMFVSKDARCCVMYTDDIDSEALPEELFFALRESYLYLASLHDMYCLHSASVKYQNSDEALLFSGPSGMGKSTHTGLWNKYENTSYINGDLNLLALEDGVPVIKGIPWCGTSGICDNRTHPVRAVTLLQKGPENIIIPMDETDIITGVFMRITSPRFDRDMTEKIIDFLNRFCSGIRVRKLSCTVSEEAVKTIKKELF